MKSSTTPILLGLAAIFVAACSTKEPPQVDPNLFPKDYRRQLVFFLQENLSERSEFLTASISEPTLTPVGDAQRYVVCMQFTSSDGRHQKAFIYLGGTVQQYIDATPALCGKAVYRPYTELATAAPKA
ncbi:MAG TPA: hypothetical protein VFB45_11295 [Pseudolabrys sp.]|nr:hypothetical protein [Pseudolabrys sp.]